MTKYDYLLDDAFLKQINYSNNITLHCRIFVMNRDEAVIGTIEGKTSGGSLSLNGSSAIRRTGSLTIIADDSTYRITDVRNLLAIDKLIEIEVGIDNLTTAYSATPILWFPLGHFVIGNASISYSSSGLTISLSLKDKMALLNGESGGTFNTSIIHSPIYTNETDEDGLPIKANVRFRDLIYSIMKDYSGLPMEKIVIEDIDLRIKNIVRWVGQDNVWIKKEADGVKMYFNPPADPNSNSYCYGFNQDIGYIWVDFTYPGELSTKAGDTIYALLDKIKNALGNYEFFFDVNGVFHFQMIKNYVNEGSAENWLTDAINDKYLLSNSATGKAYYDFSNAKNVSYSNAPQYAKIKNDYVVWGEFPDSKLPIRYHVVIDTPPSAFHSWNVTLVEEQLSNYTIKRATAATIGTGNGAITPTDWRTELYFQCIANPENVTYYSKELVEEWPKVYNIEAGSYYTGVSQLSYFFDMIDPKSLTDQQMAQFSVDQIGLRTKVTNDNKVNCLFASIPNNYFYIESGSATANQDRIDSIRDSGADSFIQVAPNIMSKIAVGTASNSAFDLIRSNLNESISYGETINITTMPIYHLEPNMRIRAKNDETNINGDYQISTMSIPLTLNGTMTISATRITERI